MRHSFSDDAIVLRTYDVGETDRFCLLLTKHHGRISARVRGARRLNSRKGGSLLPLHAARVEIEGKGGHFTVTGAAQIRSNTQAWNNFQALSIAEQGIELVLKLVEEGEPVSEVYALTDRFIQACGQRQRDLFPVFVLQLLSLLGALPSLTHSSMSHRPFNASDSVLFNPLTGALSARGEDAHARSLSADLVSLLRILPSVDLSEIPALSDGASSQLLRFAYSLLGNQLGSNLNVLPLTSSGATPT